MYNLHRDQHTNRTASNRKCRNENDSSGRGVQALAEGTVPGRGNCQCGEFRVNSDIGVFQSIASRRVRYETFVCQSMSHKRQTESYVPAKAV